MKGTPIVLVFAALTASCTHTEVVKTAAAPAPKPATVWDRQVHNAIDAGDGDLQFRQLREKVAAEPDNIPARLDLARAYRERGYHEIALEISRLAVARFPDSGPAQLSLVRDLRQVNRRTEAIAVLEAFLKTHPQTAPEYYSWLGILRDESGLWPLGEPAHRKAIELAAGDDYLHNNLGYNLLMQKKNEEAAAEFREALRLNPASELARNNLGLALANSNAAGQAVANWQSTTDAASAHNNLAVVWIEKGNYSEARKELEVALSLDKNNAAALKNLELISRLSGTPAALAMESKPDETRWDRWKSSMKRLFVGPLEEPRKDVAKTASAQ
ncbi:MAG TPA: tetratricopeptide repeat protein [Candidatus Acidoferrales bacterium]|nr:tetratricopeptide repeat protein [Candidatus Acidoferrales bacterium]